MVVGGRPFLLRWARRRAEGTALGWIAVSLALSGCGSQGGGANSPADGSTDVDAELDAAVADSGDVPPDVADEDANSDDDTIGLDVSDVETEPDSPAGDVENDTSDPDVDESQDVQPGDTGQPEDARVTDGSADPDDADSSDDSGDLQDIAPDDGSGGEADSAGHDGDSDVVTDPGPLSEPGWPSSFWRPAMPFERCTGSDGFVRRPYPPLAQELWRVSVPEPGFSSPYLYLSDVECEPLVVVGFGEELSSTASTGSLYAWSGADGREAWRLVTTGEVFGRPLEISLTRSGAPLLVASGRHGQLDLVEAETGEVNLSFSRSQSPFAGRWNNVMVPRQVGDLNMGGVEDLVTAHGALTAGAVAGDVREPNQLLVLSGADLSVIWSLDMPDGAESYMNPVVMENPAGIWVLFGSGGETQPGSLWRIGLTDLAAGRMAEAVRVGPAGGPKGVLAPPSIVDLTGDGVADVVMSLFDGRTAAVDGATWETLWTHRVDGAEAYSNPAVGQFDSDGIPDTAVVYSRGVFPSYTGSRFVVLSGADGTELWAREDANVVPTSSALMMDLSGDGLAEAIFTSSSPRSGLQVGSASSAHAYAVLYRQPGGFSFGTPTIADVNADGGADLVVSTLVADGDGESAGLVVALSLGRVFRDRGSWPGYMGVLGDGHFRE